MSIINVSVYSKALVLDLSQSSCLLCSDESRAADVHLLRMLLKSHLNWSARAHGSAQGRGAGSGYFFVWMFSVFVVKCLVIRCSRFCRVAQDKLMLYTHLCIDKSWVYAKCIPPILVRNKFSFWYISALCVLCVFLLCLYINHRFIQKPIEHYGLMHVLFFNNC